MSTAQTQSLDGLKPLNMFRLPHRSCFLGNKRDCSIFEEWMHYLCVWRTVCVCNSCFVVLLNYIWFYLGFVWKE